MQLHIKAEHCKLRAVVSELRATHDPGFTHRWLQLKKSGEALPVEIFRPLRHGESNARLVVAIDISGKLRAEEELANQRHFRESLLETLPVPVFHKDRAGRYLGVNQAFTALLGQSRDFFVGRTVWDIAPKQLATIYDEADETLYAQPDAVQVYSAKLKSASLGSAMSSLPNRSSAISVARLGLSASFSMSPNSAFRNAHCAKANRVWRRSCTAARCPFS